MSVEYTFPSQNIRQTAASVYLPTGAQAAAGAAADFSFKDVIDSVNPLQQLPVIGTLYRALSGDTISTAAQIMGGALFGGPMGFAVSALTAGMAPNGGGIGDMVVSALTGGGNSDTPADHQYAAALYQKAQGMIS